MAGPSAVRDEVVHACGRGGWRATKAILVRPPGAGYASGKVERLINRLKQFRRIATRYEKRATNYLAVVNLGMIMLWL